MRVDTEHYEVVAHLRGMAHSMNDKITSIANEIASKQADAEALVRRRDAYSEAATMLEAFVTMPRPDDVSLLTHVASLLTPHDDPTRLDPDEWNDIAPGMGEQ